LAPPSLGTWVQWDQLRKIGSFPLISRFSGRNHPEGSTMIYEAAVIEGGKRWLEAKKAMLGDDGMHDQSGSRKTVHLRHEIRTIEKLEAFRAMRREWDELAAAAGDCSICMTYQYCELAATLALGKGGLVAVGMLYDDHDLLAIWPLAIQFKDPLL
jgi:hypothetical protein